MRPLKVFISYSHADEAFKKELEKHLKLLVRTNFIEPWQDRQIEGGMNIDDQINTHLSNAEIILLLISADFIHSDYCYSRELKAALQKHEQGEARVVPVILRKCAWHSAEFGMLNALPADGKPIKSFIDQDEGFTSVVEGLKTIVNTLRESPNFKTAGNSSTIKQKQAKKDPVLKHINMRLTDEIIDEINLLRQNRERKLGSPKLGISIRDWILEAVLEKLDKEKKL